MQEHRVVITGLGIVCAAGPDVKSFWASVVAGESALAPITREDFAEFESAVGGVVPEEWLDGDGPADVPFGTERVSRMALTAAREAMRDSGLDLDPPDPARIGLVLGKCQGERKLPGGDYQWMHAPSDVVATALGIRGPRLMVSTACAAGANAVGLAKDKIWTGEADVVLAGGVDVLNPVTFGGFHGLQATSSEPCAPYSRSDGLNLGEGAAFLVVESLERALARGATVLAEVLGYGLSADAYHPTAPDPTGRGALLAVLRALDDAGVDADAIDYVNGHGTGTPANDRMERKVMRSLFRERVAHVPLSSTKSFVGHTLGAAGAIESLTSVLAVRDDLLPPTANFDSDAQQEEFDFVPGPARPKRLSTVMSSSYAFGGNNASVIFAKPSNAADRTSRRDGWARVSITGIGAVGGLGVGIDEWRAALREGRSGIGPITTFDATPYGCQFAAEMPALDGRAFASPNEWRHMDPITRQSLAAVRLAIEDARLPLGRAEREQTAVILGTGFGPASTGLMFDDNFGTDVRVKAFAHVTMNAPAGLICKTLGVRGPTTTITTGALSGTLALAAAFELVAFGRAPAAVVVAADELFEYWVAARAADGALAPDGVVRPFDRHRTGTALGGAAVALVLERSDLVTRRGAIPYCDVLATCHTGEPTGRAGVAAAAGWTRAIDGALGKAGVDADAVGFCAAWSAGTHEDETEARALGARFGAGVPVAAAKSMTGDCEAASGLVNVLTCALALKEGWLPATANLVAPISDPVLDHVRETRVAHPSAALALDADHGNSFGAALLTRSVA